MTLVPRADTGEPRDHAARIDAAREASPIFAAALEACRLKRRLRRGWLDAGIGRVRCESVADHSYGVALLALLFLGEADDREAGDRGTGDPELDRARVLELALLHDLPEAATGDVTPMDAISPEEKRAAESRAIDAWRQGLGAADRLRARWDELDAVATPEAKLVKMLDKLEMAIQAVDHRAVLRVDTSAFLESVRAAVDRYDGPRPNAMRDLFTAIESAYVPVDR